MLKYWYHKWDSITSTVAKLYGSLWIAQSFTPASAFACSGATVFLTRTGSPTGNLTLSLYAADGSGNPTGAALATGLIDVATTYGWDFAAFVSSPCRVTFASPVSLSASTQYVLVANFSGGTSANYLLATSLVTGDLSGGNMKHSSNAGGSWTDDTNDIIFDLWDATADGSSFVAIDTISSYHRFLEIHRGTSGSTVTRTISVSAVVATTPAFCKTATYLYVGMGTRIYRFSYDLVRDTVWDYIEPGGNIRDIDVAEDQDVLVYATSTERGAYTISTKALLHSTGSSLTVRVDSTEDRLFQGSSGTGAILSRAVKPSDGTAIVTQWTGTGAVNSGVIRQATGAIFLCMTPSSGYLSVREYPATSGTYIWRNDHVGPASVIGHKMIHLPEDGVLIIAHGLSGGTSLSKVVDDGSSYSEGSVGGDTYDVIEFGDDLLVASNSGDDGGGVSTIRVVSKTDFSVLWRFDADLLAKVYAVEVLVIDHIVDFTVSGKGEILIEADAELVGDPDPVENVVVPTDTSDYYNIYPLVCRPETPLVEHLVFSTQISQPLDGVEIRHVNRHVPRIQFEMKLPDKRQWLESLLFGQAMDYVGIPFWHEPVSLTQAGLATDDHVHVTSTTYSQFLAGQWVFLVSRNGNTFEVKKLLTVADTQLTFTSLLENDYSVKAEVLPLSRGWTQSISISKKLDYAVYDIKADVEPIDNDLGVTPYTDGELSLTAVNYGDGLRETITRPAYQRDSRFGLMSQTVGFDRSLRGSVLGFRTSSRAGLWTLRLMLYRLCGKAISFNLASFSREMIPSSALVSGSTALNIVRCGYTEFVQSRRGNIRVVLTDGTVLSKTVLTSQVISSTIERLTVSSAWGSTVPVSSISRIEYLDSARLDTDDIVIQHRNALGYASCEVPIKYLIVS